MISNWLNCFIMNAKFRMSIFCEFLFSLIFLIAGSSGPIFHF